MCEKTIGKKARIYRVAYTIIYFYSTENSLFSWLKHRSFRQIHEWKQIYLFQTAPCYCLCNGGGLIANDRGSFFCVVYIRIILIPISSLYLRMSSIDHHSRWKKCQIGNEDTEIHGCFSWCDVNSLWDHCRGSLFTNKKSICKTKQLRNPRAFLVLKY